MVKKKSNIEPVVTIIRNVLITFVEAGFGVWYAAGMKADKVAIGAAIGAGVSVVWNTVIKPLLKKAGWIK